MEYNNVQDSYVTGDNFPVAGSGKGLESSLDSSESKLHSYATGLFNKGITKKNDIMRAGKKQVSH